MFPILNPDRTGHHFICCCNKRTRDDKDYSIAQAVLRHTGNVLGLSQEQLAAESHLSEASVSRFFRRCGFGSFYEFKTQFALFLNQRRLVKTRGSLARFHGKDPEEIGHLLWDAAQRNLAATRESLDIAALERMVELLAGAKTVYFVGDTRDLYCFYSMQLDLVCAGHTAYLYNIDEIRPDALPELDEGTVVCIVTVDQNWYADEIAHLCEAARRKNTQVLLLGQEPPARPELLTQWYRYGLEGSGNDGYYSLPLLGQIMSTLLLCRI